MYIEVGAAATLGVSPADIKTISAPPTMAIHLLRMARQPTLAHPRVEDSPIASPGVRDANLARVTPVASSSVIVQTVVDHR